MTRNVLRLTAASLALGLALSACGGGDDSTSGEDSGKNPIVGLIGPKSGSASFYWTELERGIELAAPDMEEQFGVTFDLVEQDDKGSPEVASRAVQTLLNDENVDVIFGPSQSGPSLQVAETIQRTGRPWLVPIAAADEIVDPNADPNWAFRTNNNNTQAISVSGDYLWKDDATVGIFYAADAYGQSNRDLLFAYAEENGLDVAQEEVIQPGATDVSPAVQRMADAGATSVFIAVSTGADTSAITKAMAQVGYTADRVLTTATVLSGYTDLAEPAEWKNLAFIEPRDLTSPNFTDLVDRYVDEYGEEPTSSVAVYTTYTAAMLYAQAVSEVGNASDREAVRKAMEDTPSLEIVGRTFEQPFGAEDHELYDDDASGWFVLGFEPDGTLTTLGPVSEQ